jgi:stalled ribosome rescue protein Dom34
MGEANKRWVDPYSKLYKQMRQLKCKTFIDFLVISEFIYRFISIQFKIKNMRKSDFKDFRNSREGKNIIEEIYSHVKNILLRYFIITGKKFLKEDINDFLVINGMDFNDQGIASVCQGNDFILLTNDVDFKNSDLEILSINPELLKP